MKEINITYIGKTPFSIAMQLAFSSEYDNSKILLCDGYILEDNTMILSAYCRDEKVIKFPYKLNVNQIIEFVYGWLQNAKPNEPEPDSDGTVKVGFTITTDKTDYRKYFGTFIAIKPAWIVYGK